MSELSPEAQALLDDVRSVGALDDARRARLREALRARLATPAPRPWFTRPAAWAAGGAVAAALVIALLVARRGPTAAPERVHASRPSATEPVTPASAPPAEHAPPSPSASAPPAENAPPLGAGPTAAAPLATTAPSPRLARREAPSEDTLAAELALLTRAQRALQQGDAAAALEALETHARRFPAGQLLEERLGARARALCAAGRRAEGRRALAQLVARFPRSPLLPAARGACDDAP